MEWERCYISYQYDPGSNPTGSITLTFIGAPVEDSRDVQGALDSVLAMLKQDGWEQAETVPVFAGVESSGMHRTSESIWFRRASPTEGTP